MTENSLKYVYSCLCSCCHALTAVPGPRGMAAAQGHALHRGLLPPAAASSGGRHLLQALPPVHGAAGAVFGGFWPAETLRSYNLSSSHSNNFTAKAVSIRIRIFS